MGEERQEKSIRLKEHKRKDKQESKWRVGGGNREGEKVKVKGLRKEN